MRSVAVALALACTVTVEPQTLDLSETLWISPEFTTEEQQIILDAIEEWHEATGGIVALQPAIGHGRPGVVPAEIPQHYVGYWDERARLILLEQVSPFVILHEIGHGLGLEHREGTLMAPVVHDRACIDTVTLHVLSATRGLDPAYMLTTCPTEIN